MENRIFRIFLGGELVAISTKNGKVLVIPNKPDTFPNQAQYFGLMNHPDDLILDIEFSSNCNTN